MTPYMPEVDAIREHQEATLRMARQIAVKGKVLRPGGVAERCVAFVTPGRVIIPIPCRPRDSCGPDMVAALRRIVPDEEPQTITVIAFNELILPDRLKQRGITGELINSLIPFLGYLIGLTSIGHSVVVFEGHSSALALGCRDSDLLLVDEAMCAHLPEDWVGVVGGVLRKPRVLVFGRDGRIIPVDPASAQRFAVPDQNVLKVDPFHFEGLVREIGAAPLLLTMPNPESYLPKVSADAAPQLGKKRCPRCGKELNIYAVKCRFCKTEL